MAKGEVCYTCVRKVKWDALWHAMYETKNREGKKYETWDRVGKSEALRIANKMEKGKEVPRGSCETRRKWQ
jgi:hypothetical protein